MEKRWTVVWVLVCAACLGVCPAALADFFDSFSDGFYERDPNDPAYDANEAYWTDPNNPVLWDIDNPDWTIHDLFGDDFYYSAHDGWLDMKSVTYFFPYVVVGASVADGDVDPNTSMTYFDDSVSHYIVTRVRNPDWRDDPNDDRGIIAIGMHVDTLNWETLWLRYEFGDNSEPHSKDGAWFAVATLYGLDAYTLKQTDIGRDPAEYDANDPNFTDDPNWADFDPNRAADDPNNLWAVPDWMKEHDGFWIAYQYDRGDPNYEPGDPNGKFMRAACWNGGKHDWNGQWDLSCDLGDWQHFRHVPDDPNDPGSWWPAWYWSEGHVALLIEGEPHPDPLYGFAGRVAYDGVEVRIGTFTNESHTLQLDVKNASKGTIAIDPDLLDDSNNVDPNAMPVSIEATRRYTAGTEVVLVAEPLSGSSFKSWTIFDPNWPGDRGHAVEDTNSVLYLTMSADWEVEASFACGSSEMLPPIGMVLLALGAAVVVRRLL